MKSLFVIFVFTILVPTLDCFCQNANSAHLEGPRTIKVLEIYRYESTDQYVFKALDKDSKREVFVFSDKQSQVKCGEEGQLVGIERNKSYQVKLRLYPLFPLTVPNDSLGVIFDNRP
ncbi:MAG: hypothetical protein RLO12_06355, partial [Fulvivirga sp.]